MGYMILIPIFLSGIVGIGMLSSCFREYVSDSDTTQGKVKQLRYGVGITLFICMVTAICSAIWVKESIVLFKFIDGIDIKFSIDVMGRIFIIFTSVIWFFVGMYAFKYMEHEGKEKKFYGFYLLTYSVLIAQDMAANMITFYLFYELMTLVSAPLVMHTKTKQSVMATCKYLFFSMFGAYLALFGIAFMYKYCNSLDFVVGGSLNIDLLGTNKTILLIAIFILIIGFGTKAGMFPLHGWLWAAHPVAPTPASAVLSAIIVKSGVLAIIRSIYYVVGVDFIKGTWVQFVWIIITLATIFMGSMLAYREKNMKKRLAYSTISQVSYILFGIALANKVAFVGAILHIVFHAVIKTVLFLCAGVFITRTGKKMVSDYRGIGKTMSISLMCYTVASLALIGIPPLSGFISKWYLALGGFGATNKVIGIVGVAILLVSALLTAGYLLPITIDGYMPGKDSTIVRNKEEVNKMVVVLVVLALVVIVFGIFPNPIIAYISSIANKLI